MKYTIVVNQPGYLPESDPIDIEIDGSGECGHEAEQVLGAILDEVERNAPMEEEDRYSPWQSLLVRIAYDLEHANDFNPRGGFLYHMPDGYVIEATYHAD